MMLEQGLKDRIAKEGLFIHVHHDKALDGTLGEAMLQYAIELRKRVVVWMLPGREQIPLPPILAGIPGLDVVYGEAEDVFQPLMALAEATPGTVSIDSEGYEAPHVDRCVACGVALEGPIRREAVYIDPAMVARGEITVAETPLCDKPECLRAVREVMDEQGKKEVRSSDALREALGEQGGEGGRDEPA